MIGELLISHKLCTCVELPVWVCLTKCRSSGKSFLSFSGSSGPSGQARSFHISKNATLASLFVQIHTAVSWNRTYETGTTVLVCFYVFLTMFFFPASYYLFWMLVSRFGRILQFEFGWWSVHFVEHAPDASLSHAEETVHDHRNFLKPWDFHTDHSWNDVRIICLYNWYATTAKIQRRFVVLLPKLTSTGVGQVLRSSCIVLFASIRCRCGFWKHTLGKIHLMTQVSRNEIKSLTLRSKQRPFLYFCLTFFLWGQRILTCIDCVGKERWRAADLRYP